LPGQFVLEWTDEALNQLALLKKKDSVPSKKYLFKLSKILESAQANPFKGIGKPELLKYDYPSCWSRRINLKDRIIYQVKGKSIIIISILGHYENE
jgi:toxin YoeB